jgi:hypothetical protein
VMADGSRLRAIKTKKSEYLKINSLLSLIVDFQKTMFSYKKA